MAHAICERAPDSHCLKLLASVLSCRPYERQSVYLFLQTATFATYRMCTTALPTQASKGSCLQNLCWKTLHYSGPKGCNLEVGMCPLVNLSNPAHRFFSSLSHSIYLSIHMSGCQSVCLSVCVSTVYVPAGLFVGPVCVIYHSVAMFPVMMTLCSDLLCQCSCHSCSHISIAVTP